MKNKWKIIVPVGLIALVLVCVFGGRALVEQGNAAHKDDPTAQQSQAAEETPDATPADGSSYVKGNISTATASSAPSSSSATTSTDKPASETITVDENGTVIIEPDFKAQASSATKVTTPEAQVTANMGGSGGGRLDLGDDGAYHGDNPATPAPVPTAKPTTKPSDNTPPPVSTPKPETPNTTPTEQPIPSANPSDDGGSSTTPDGGNGAPSHTGHNGEISPDGKWGWLDGFGWIEVGGSDGGLSGDYSDQVTGGLSGEKVGSM